MMVARGFGSIITGGMSVTWPAASSEQGWFRMLFKINKPGLLLPVGFLWVIFFVILMSLFLNKTRPGRYIIAIGSNKEATRLSGVNVVKYQALAYILSGVFAGIAGVAYAAVFSSSIAPVTAQALSLTLSAVPSSAELP